VKYAQQSRKITTGQSVQIKFFSNFYYLHFSVGLVLMIASPSEKKKRSKASVTSKVRGIGGKFEQTFKNFHVEFLLGE
jgi:hypothetical protein